MGLQEPFEASRAMQRRVLGAPGCCWNCSLGVCGCQLNISRAMGQTESFRTCEWQCLLLLTYGCSRAVGDPHCKFMALYSIQTCLDVPEISLSPLSTPSSQALMLSSMVGNIEEKRGEGFEASVVLCPTEMQVAPNVSGCASRRK